MTQLQVVPINWIERLLDTLMMPIMWALQGFALECPQRTHRWNNAKLVKDDVAHLTPFLMVEVRGAEEAGPRWQGFIPRFHIPFFGWRKYVVLRPDGYQGNEWFVGWISKDGVVGVSRIPVKRLVRVLIGSSDVAFFGITRDGRQIHLTRIGEGHVGEGGMWSGTPLH